MKSEQDPTPEARWRLTLYVFKGTLPSSNALATLRRICREELEDRVELEVIDIHEHPEALEADNILAIPTLVKRLPPPLRHIVGDLSREEVLRAALELLPLPETNSADDLDIEEAGANGS